MFAPISIDDFLNGFLNDYRKTNPKEDIAELRAALNRAVAANKSGAVCHICGRLIWAIGSATVGWDGCFTCITGETDESEDYEIDSVCF
jgi:hypothetical protein